MTQTQSSTRMALAFSWSEVSPPLLRQMIRAWYEAHKAHQESAAAQYLAELPKVKDESLPGLATSSIGKTPKPNDTGVFFDLWRRVWLPKAQASDVIELATMVRAGLPAAYQGEPIRSRAKGLAFLADRNATVSFKTNLRSQFMKAHRTRHQVEVRPSRQTDTGPLDLVGEGAEPQRAPYPHQLEAHAALDQMMRKRPENRAGLIVLPTGAGKTDTAAVWLLNRMNEDHELRVLWLSHQTSLLTQAQLRFAVLAKNLPVGFCSRSRVVATGRSAISTIADPRLTVAFVSHRSLSVKLAGRKHDLLRAFLSRPTIVVVDEAHHAGSAGYEVVLDACRAIGIEALIGLTATPWPTGSEARRRLHQRFPLELIRREPHELVESGILARPVITTIATGQAITLSTDERDQADRMQDLPPSVLRRLETAERDALVVRAMVDRRDQWGKTLVFVSNIAHADSLDAQLNSRLAGTGVESRALHSQVDDPEGVLDWFQKSEHAVLVSVGMLTEGVDLPDAATAVLVRPTTSRILLRQMIGRVLRGPKAGGTAEANVVYLRDQWRNFGDVLEPGDVLDVSVPGMSTGSEVDDVIRPLPPIAADDDSDVAEVPSDVEAAVLRQVRDTERRMAELAKGALVSPSFLESTKLVGYYDLGDRKLVVFEHQVDSYGVLITDAGADYTLQGVPLLSYFDEGPPPYPARRVLEELVDHVRNHGQAPPFVSVGASVGPRLAAEMVRDAGAISVTQRHELVRSQFDASLNRATYASLERFEEAVDRAVRDLDAARRSSPEEITLQGRPSRKRPPRARPARELQPLLRETLAIARTVLPIDVAARLTNPPPVNWTNRPSTTTWAHWSIQLHGKAIGRQAIRVSCSLDTTKKIVSDEMLRYLLYHELLHHLLPGQGHDAEFYEYERLWPNSLELDARLDTLSDDWNFGPG